MESLLAMVENYKVTKELKSDEKFREKSESRTAPSPIFIPDDSNLSTTIKDHWIKCGGICLSKRDLQKFTGDKELSDLHINVFQNLLKGQINSIGGLQSTLLQQKKSSLSNKKEKKNLQAINI